MTRDADDPAREPPPPYAAPPRRHWLGWTLSGVIVAGGLLVTLALSFVYVVHCGGGDGGEPFTAADSPQGVVCRSAGGWTGLLIPGGWLVATAVLLWMCARWTRGRTDTYGLAWSMVLPLVVPLVAYTGLNAPSDECDADKRSDPAYECDHY